MTYTPPTPPSDGTNGAGGPTGSGGYPGVTPPPYGQPNGAPNAAPYGAPAGAPAPGAPTPGSPYGAPPAGSPYGAPAPGSPYGQPNGGSPYGAPGGVPNGAPEVKNFLAFSIISTVLFWPVGLFAIIKSTQVKSNLNVGNYQGAVESSKSAKTLALIATIIGGLSFLASIAIIIFSFVVTGLAVGSAVSTIEEYSSSNSSSVTEDTQAQLSATVTGTGSATIIIAGGSDGFKSYDETFSGTYSNTVTIPAGGSLQFWIYPDGNSEGTCEIIANGVTLDSDTGFIPMCGTD